MPTRSAQADRAGRPGQAGENIWILPWPERAITPRYSGFITPWSKSAWLKQISTIRTNNRGASGGQFNSILNYDKWMNLRKGDIYWLLAADDERKSDITHPHVVMEVVAGSEAALVLVCPLTSNLKRVSRPGNVLLEAGEANLPMQSVVEVGKITVVEVSRLGEYIGTLSAQRVKQILSGNRFLRAMRRPSDKGQA